jgi:hypothetical protein
MRRVDFGDTVRIVSTTETVAAGHADRTGICYGFTTPSVTGVQVVGDAGGDEALNITFEDGSSAWFEPSLVTLVDVGAGQVAVIGDTRLIRNATGEWVDAPDSD